MAAGAQVKACRDIAAVLHRLASCKACPGSAHSIEHRRSRAHIATHRALWDTVQYSIYAALSPAAQQHLSIEENTATRFGTDSFRLDTGNTNENSTEHNPVTHRILHREPLLKRVVPRPAYPSHFPASWKKALQVWRSQLKLSLSMLAIRFSLQSLLLVGILRCLAKILLPLFLSGTAMRQI